MPAPVPNDDNRVLLARYRKAAGRERAIFAGRLGEYRYYNMDQAVAAALALFETIAKGAPARP